VSRNKNVVSIAILLGVLLLLPLAISGFAQGVMTKMLIAALFATGFGILIGQAGLLSFGHAALYGIGAVTTIHVMMLAERGTFDMPTPLLPLAGGIAGALLAAFAGYFATRRAGAYFTLITLAMAELVHVIAVQWQPVFGGEAGLTAMRMPWAGIGFATPVSVYYSTLAWVVACLVIAWLFTRTPFGRLTVAIRENEERVVFLGYNVHMSKVIVFALSGALSGIAGGLLVMANESGSYSLFIPYVSLEVVFYAFIGGTSFFLGPAFAAAVLTFLPFALSGMTRLWPLYQGLLFMLLMLYAPTGAAGLLQSQASLFRKLPVTRWLRIQAHGIAGAILVIGAFVLGAEVTHATPALDKRLMAWAAAAVAFVFGIALLRKARSMHRDAEALSDKETEPTTAGTAAPMAVKQMAEARS
jgi:branched-chain amino acid transport system permease protein